MSLQFSIGDVFDSGRGVGSGFSDTLIDIFSAVTPSLIDIFTGRDSPSQFGPLFPQVDQFLFGNGNGNGVCPIELRTSRTNPGGPPETSVWRRVDGCFDKWARVPRGFKPIVDCCGQVTLKRVRRRRRGISGRDVSGAMRVSSFVSKFGVKSKVPTKRKTKHRR